MHTTQQIMRFLPYQLVPMFFHQQHTCLSVDTSWSNQHQIALTVVVVWAVFWVGGFTCWRSEASVKMFAICCPHSFSQWCDCKDYFNPLMLWSTPSRKARECTDNWHPLIPTLMSLQLRVLVFGIVGSMSFGGGHLGGSCPSLIYSRFPGMILRSLQLLSDCSFIRNWHFDFTQTQDMQEALVLFTYWNVLGSMMHVVVLDSGMGYPSTISPRNIMDIGEGEPLFGNFEYEDMPCGQKPHNNLIWISGKAWESWNMSLICTRVIFPYFSYFHVSQEGEFGLGWTVKVRTLGTTTHYRCASSCGGKCNKIQPRKAVAFLVEQRQVGLDLSMMYII